MKLHQAKARFPYAAMHTGKRVLASVCWLVLTGQLLHFVQKLAEQVQSGPDGLGRAISTPAPRSRSMGSWLHPPDRKPR